MNSSFLFGPRRDTGMITTIMLLFRMNYGSLVRLNRMADRSGECMFRPDFIHTNEEWVVWLLGEEFHTHATPRQLEERTRLLPAQVDEAVRNLERIRALLVVRIPGRFPPDNVETVGLQKHGQVMYEDLKRTRGF
jgi:hypothetical protein